MKRLAEFFRSSLPSDRAQILFVSGIVCLFIARDLRYWPAEAISIASNRLLDPLELWQQASTVWRGIFIFAQFLPFLAGSAGGFICFWPGSRPSRRMFYWVCVPALAGLSLISGQFLLLLFGNPLALQTNRKPVETVGWALSVLWKMGPGFHFALLGLVLVALFFSRLVVGCSSLPLALPKSSVSSSDDDVSWNRVERFLWILVVLLPALLWTLPVMYSIYSFLNSRFASFSHNAWLSVFPLVIGDAIYVVVAVWMIGKEAREALSRAVRLPTPKSIVIAITCAVGVAAFISFGQFFVDRSRWTIHQDDSFGPPQFSSYYRVPSLGLLTLLFVAFIEEIMFRGLLQPRFIRRFGLLRGIFLLAIVFAAWHFTGDFSYQMTSERVVLGLGLRLCSSLAVGFLLGWLSIQAHSVIPAVVAHGLNNILITSPFGPRFLGLGPVNTLLWGVLAYVLFRYWPVRVERGQESELVITTPSASSD